MFSDILRETNKRLAKFWRRVRDGIPSPPSISPNRFWRWLQVSQRRRRNFQRCAVVLAFLVTAAVIATLARPRFNNWRARRLARESEAFMRSGDWTTAEHKLSRALELSPAQTDCMIATARFLTGTGENESAVEWWRRVSGSKSMDRDDHRDFASAALASNELYLAEQEIGSLLTSATPEDKDLLLGAQLSLTQGRPSDALRSTEKILRDPAADPTTILRAAALSFLNPAAGGAETEQACQRLCVIARDPTQPIALDALTLLLGQPMANGPATITGAFSQPVKTRCNCIDLAEIMTLLRTHPGSRGYHRILAWDIARQMDPDHAETIIEKAVPAFVNADDETVFALCLWLHSMGRYSEELRVNPEERAGRRQELLLQRAEALVALGEFEKAVALMSAEHSAVAPFFEHMQLAVIRAKMGNAASAANEWQRAIDSAETTQQLLVLARFAEKNDENEVADLAYSRALVKQSRLYSAYVARLQLAESADNTQKAEQIARDIYQRWPEDSMSEMHYRYLELLVGASESETKVAEEKASLLLEKNPWHLGARMVLSLARLSLGKKAEALAAVSDKSLGKPAPPLAVRAAALCANGWTEAGHAEAEKLVVQKLLPEERSLIAPALAARN
jgi:tetratricopeptide (TPR) repeat protein